MANKDASLADLTKELKEVRFLGNGLLVVVSYFQLNLNVHVFSFPLILAGIYETGCAGGGA